MPNLAPWVLGTYQSLVDVRPIVDRLTYREKKSPKLNVWIRETLEFKMSGLYNIFRAAQVPFPNMSTILHDIYSQLTGTCFNQFSSLMKSLHDLITVLWNNLVNSQTSIDQLNAEMTTLQAKLLKTEETLKSLIADLDALKSDTEFEMEQVLAKYRLATAMQELSLTPGPPAAVPSAPSQAPPPF